MKKITFFTTLTVILMLAASFGQNQSKTAQSTVLTPTTIGEFVTPATYEELEDEEDFDGTYMYRPDPKGKYYHFETFVSDGDTQWDAYWMYEEKFTATSTLAPSGNIRYDAKNLQNAKFTGEDSYRSNNHGGNREVTWCEGVKGYGIGERVTMSVRTRAEFVGKEDEICFWALMIVNGYAKNETTWKNNTRVKVLRLYVGGNYWCDLHLQDIIKPQIFELPKHLKIYPGKVGKKIPEKGAFSRPYWDYSENSEGSVYHSPKIPVFQTDLTFEIIEVYPGDKYDDTCITGIALNTSGGIY